MAITLDDFDKIWASTSPLTPYSFGDANYKEGWNFVGATPPSRQMWDFLQKNNDEKMQYLATTYLPLSGGNITGGLTVQNNSVVTTKVVDLASSFSINITSGNATHLSATLIVKKIGNIMQLYVGFTATTAINVGGTIYATISGIPLPVVPCGFAGYTGSAAAVGTLNGSTLSIRIIGSNLASGSNFAVCMMYAVAE